MYTKKTYDERVAFAESLREHRGIEYAFGYLTSCFGFIDGPLEEHHKTQIADPEPFESAMDAIIKEKTS